MKEITPVAKEVSAKMLSSRMEAAESSSKVSTKVSSKVSPKVIAWKVRRSATVESRDANNAMNAKPEEAALD